MSNLYEKWVKKEERKFLSLCSIKDRQKLSKKIPMSFYDYMRFNCLLSRMNFPFYQDRISERFPNLEEQRLQMLKRHRDILEEYPNYYEDEEFDKQVRTWLIEFIEQIPSRNQQKIWSRQLRLYLEEILLGEEFDL